MRGNARKVRVFHKLEINEQTSFVSAASGYITLTRRSARALTQVVATLCGIYVWAIRVAWLK
jgi:hypothetical protein